jgi:YHS domain-containing protein
VFISDSKIFSGHGLKGAIQVPFLRTPAPSKRGVTTRLGGHPTAPKQTGHQRDTVRRIKGVKNMTKDPVCGMQVDEKKSPTSVSEGKKYAFCSESCKDEFDANPKLYVSSTDSHSGKESHKEETRRAKV